MPELLEKFEGLEKKIVETQKLLDLEAKKIEIKKLEFEIAEPDFWKEQEKARRVSQELSELREEVEGWEGLKKEVLDAWGLMLEAQKTPARFESRSESGGQKHENTRPLRVAKRVGQAETRKHENAENTPRLRSGQAETLDDSLLGDLEKEYERLERKYDELEFYVLLGGKYDKQNAILSIHAGAGGVDAQDWALMLLRMFLRYCEKKGFKAKIIDKSAGGEAGIKSAVIEVIGKYAYGFLKSEAGVHRLVRISPFDAEKMRHTSFAMVEVLPEMDEVGVEIRADDLRIDTFCSSGAGGQSVNTTYSAVRIVHKPTGIQVVCQNERSQQQNKETALKILKSKVYQYYQAEREEEKQVLRGEFKEAAWGNQIRSYVLQPYKLVKDHRTGFETQEVEAVLDGGLEGFVGAYLREAINKINNN